MLLIVLEVHFSLLFSNKAYFRVCFVVCKIWSPFFSCRPLLLGISIPNDIANNRNKDLQQSTEKLNPQVFLNFYRGLVL